MPPETTQETTQETRPPATAADAEGRAARIAVTIFPLLVLLAGIVGFLIPAQLKPLSSVVPYLLGFVMFCMGLTLTTPDFRRIARRPWAVAVGLCAHYVIMPLSGWTIAHLLGLPPELAAGVILVGCAPSGTASNVVAYLARGDVALSVSVTTVSPVLAPLLTPLLTLLLAGTLLQVQAGAMVVSILQTVLVPIVLGVVVRLLLRDRIQRVAPVFPWLSTVAIAVIVAAVVAGSASAIVSAGLVVLLAVVLHNGFGLLLGYLAAWAGRLDQRARRAMAVEVGMQNSGLAASLATSYFSPLAALPAAVFSVWHNLSGAIFATVMGRRAVTDES